MAGISLQPPTAFRHEKKHQINLREDLVLSCRLRKLFAHDSHAGEDGSYRVTSLYFDTPYDDALRDKKNGVSQREKFRLRYYGKAPDAVRVEKKSKNGSLCAKRSAWITLEQTRLLLQGDSRFLLESQDPLLLEFYSKIQRGLRPKTIVRYDREAFFYRPGNVRITLDRNLKTGLGNLDFLAPQLFCLQAMDDPAGTVLEVKYDAFLPDLVRLAVQVPGRQAQSCSKYALCRRFD